jgi:hypothetical protein
VLVVCVTLCTVALLPILVRAESPTEVVIPQPSDDASVYNSFPDQNYGGQTVLVFSGVWGWNQLADGLIRFDLSSVPYNVEIVSATLQLKETSEEYFTDNFFAHRILVGPWSENAVTWNTIPGFLATPTSSVAKNPTTLIFSWDVTSDVQGFVDGVYPNYGWYLGAPYNRGDNGPYNINLALASKECPNDPNIYPHGFDPSQDYRPKLVIMYIPSLAVPEYAFGALISLAACLTALVAVKKPFHTASCS